ncbi:type IV secretory system conjugative DNA transfer family protein [Paludicola sp. MB14-C6]|uniref:VirD4-like conjugal transfer protein, CD1115 family n=1 Tax=Paludihabitans sp. MB14-C6 TaxID=3070656 RepID=UPI0027DB1F19|nr:type IV secretory system conjugative DNA transfer family protein [Paludicola sp. MB14-C6]WMJ24296.1 type IV secretory system conjugative DNA transfer family protein [Paludicola sp. MB14-C6]
MKKQTVAKVTMIFLLCIISMLCSSVLSNFLIMTIKQRPQDAFKISCFMQSISSDQKHLMLFFILSVMIMIFLCYIIFWKRSNAHSKSEMVQITPQIEIPKPAGQKQYGGAWFTDKEEQYKLFYSVNLSTDNDLIAQLIEEGKQDIKAIKNGEYREIQPLQIENEFDIDNASIPISYEKTSKTQEHIHLIKGDIHTITFGSTRSGKTRTEVIQSICLQGLAGVDMFNSDPKGELFVYTFPTLKRLGYSVCPIDFKNPKRSIHFNFLQFIIDAVDNAKDKDDLSLATSYCWDFVDCLVKETKSDPLWSNGEKGLLAAAIMQVVFDNSIKGLHLQYPEASQEEIKIYYENKHKHYQNCTNLFHYISKMTTPNKITGNLLLEDIISVLPDKHPSKLIMAIPGSAPPKTRGSFITSALATLRLFTDPNIADMTSYTDDGLLDPSQKKAIFIILPDTKQTYYPLASLFTSQYYQYISFYADREGGRLPRNFEFNLDEFGNYSAIPFFEGNLTVAGGRGIHFHLYIQSKEQLVLKYGKELAGIILDSCTTWIYLKSTNPETLQLIEQKLGKYTVISTSASASMNDSGFLSTNNTGSTSSSTQLIGRSLLTTNEIERIKRPYVLVMADGLPSLMKVPDLHKWFFNEMLGLGNEKHNTLVRKFRENTRPEHIIKPLQLWDFKTYINRLVEVQREQELEEAERAQHMNEEMQNNFNFEDSF